MIAEMKCSGRQIEIIWIPSMNPYPNLSSFAVLVKEILKDGFEMSEYKMSSYLPLKKPYFYFGEEKEAAFIILNKSKRKGRS